MQLYQNPAIVLESLCLCEIVAVASGLLLNSQVADSKYSKSYKGNCKANHLENKFCGGPITVQKLWRKCSIKLQPQWKEYHLNPSSGVLLQFLPFLTSLILSLFFYHANIYESVFNICTCIFICSFDVSRPGLC